MKLKLTLLLLTAAVFTQSHLFAAEQGDDNPTGVAEILNGNITTGCSYDSYTGNALRAVDDIVVPGSVGAYPLKWSRYFNSHVTYSDPFAGGQWRFSYLGYKHVLGTEIPGTPDGRRISWGAYGVEDYVTQVTYPYTTETMHLADGGQVISTNYYAQGVVMYPQQIIDPYGQVTTYSWVQVGMALKLDKVTEPGGRYLKVNWDTTNSFITSVQAFDGVSSQPTQWVNYTWSNFTLSNNTTVKVLTRVDYSDLSFATYTYTDQKYPAPPQCSPPGTAPAWHAAVLSTADDVRYGGAMRQIKYQYYTTGNTTRVLSEQHLPTGNTVSTIAGVGNSQTITATETRGDGPTRTFNYHQSKYCSNCAPPDSCPEPSPIDGKLLNYTDFQGHTTTLTYETNTALPSAGFITSVADANNHTTTYTRSTLSYAILRITHPDSNHIDQTYTDETAPYFLSSRTDENNHRTDYTRDANNRITRKDYPADSNGIREYETFAYNNFDQTLTHRMKTGAYEYFKYDSRGLLTDKTNPTWTNYNYDVNNLGNWPTSEPATHYTYYGSADYNGVWTDRINTETDPRGLVTQHEYDRAYDGNGENSGLPSGSPVAGRGLVTKVIHVSDSNNYQSFGFDKYGNKLWQKDELLNKTSYAYDDYRRVLTITNPLLKFVTNTYTPTNGTNTSPYVHTTNSIYTTTTPTGIVTKNIYDQNFRKTSTIQAYGTSLAATTTFAYDPVGNPTTVTDPLNHTTTTAYDTRNRKITVTNALNQTIQSFYDAVSNVTSIQRPDGTTETKTYDQMNRALTDTVPQTNTINVTTTFNYYPGNVQYGGLMKQVIDADGHITTFTTYDPSGMKSTVTYPNGDTHGFIYDNDHNLISRRTVNGTTQNFTYDNRNRKATMAWANASPTPAPNFTAEWANFGYDAASHLNSAQNGIGTVGTGIISTITRQYDAASRLILDRQNLNATLGNKDVQYSYDDDGKDTRLYLTSAGYDYTFSYDAMGRFEKILPTGGSASFQYKYDAASNEVERDNLVNSVNQIYVRDALNRMSERDVKLNTTVLSSEAYGYDSMSRMLSVAREDGKTDAFTYYLDGELWAAQYGNPNPTRTVTYNIDQMGNRTSVVDTGVTTTYGQAAGGLNQYAQVGTNTVGNGSEHEVASYQNINYGYINDERLSSINDGNGNSYQLAYDALGRCVSRTQNWPTTGTTYYIYDGEKPIVEYSSAGGVTGRNLYGKAIDEILMRIDATLGTFYYQDDHERSVTHLSSAVGAILESYRYDVFGAPTINGGALTSSAYNNRFMFTGREYTSTFGIYEYRARAYHPGLGRFTEEDPKGFDAGDYNLFRYCGDDPLDKVDAMGLGVDELDPALWPYIDQAAHNVYEHYHNQNTIGPINPSMYPFKSEWASSVVQDEAGKLSVTKETAKGSWDRVTPPSELGKTNIFEVHQHTFPLVGNDSITGSQFSWIDIAHIDAKLSLKGGLVLIPGGRQQLFLADKNRLEFHGGAIYEASRANPYWTYLKNQNTDLRNKGISLDNLRAAANGQVHGGASNLEPIRYFGNPLIGDIADDDSGGAGGIISRHLYIP